MEAVGSDGQRRQFNHPFVQACSMFIGEMLCLLAFKLLYFYYWRKHVSFFLVNVCIYMVIHYMHSSLAHCATNKCHPDKLETNFFLVLAYNFKFNLLVVMVFILSEITLARSSWVR